MENKFEVICENFWQFRRLLKLAYDQGYLFAGAGRKHSAFYYLLYHGAFGLAFNDEEKRIWFINKGTEDYFKCSMPFEEYLKIIYGII